MRVYFIILDFDDPLTGRYLFNHSCFRNEDNARAKCKELNNKNIDPRKEYIVQEYITQD